MTTCRRRGFAFLIALGSTCLMVLSGQIATRVGSTTPRTIPPDIAAACAGDNPFLAVVCHTPRTSAASVAEKAAAAVVAFRDSPGDGVPYLLASQGEVGAVYGLAYNWHEPAVYAAAYHRRETRFGPGGPGAIYRIDLVSRVVSVWATVPDAGPDHHDISVGVHDRSGRSWAGKTSLGDLDVSDDGRDLFVMNLNDRRIYQYSLATAALVGSFPHGAAGEPWSAEARPFALAVEGGSIYHGVVRSAATSNRPSDLRAYVYASRSDGSAMRVVASFGLDYDRGLIRTNRGARITPPVRLDWLPWRDDPANVAGEYSRLSAHPMPLVSDLGFDAGSAMVLGLRDRYVDMSVLTTYYVPNDLPAAGAGDLLQGARVEDGWAVVPLPEHYRDDWDDNDESADGAIASIPRLGTVVSTGIGIYDRPGLVFQSGAYWHDAATGNRLRQEGICGNRPAPQLGEMRGTSLLSAMEDMTGLARPAFADDEPPPGALSGDIEVLCGAPRTPTATGAATPVPTGTVATTPSPSATPSPTVTAAPTRSATPTRSPTATPTPPPTATPRPAPVYLPLTVSERCVPAKQRVDLALVIDASTTMRDDRTSAGRTKLSAAIEAARGFLATMSLPQDQAAVVAFNSDAQVVQELTGRRADIEAALERIPQLVRQQTRIDRGIEAAHAELGSARRRAGSQAVMIALTDGLANPEPASTAVARARAAKADGITIFTIGLGRETELNVVELEQMASRPDYFYQAPDGEDLLAIYRTIAIEIPCPAEGYWGRR